MWSARVAGQLRQSNAVKGGDKAPMTSRNVTRRDLLKIGAATAAAELATVLLHGCGGGGASPGPSVCSKLNDIEHVVIFIQENRSFYHYFGSYRGVRGFSDQSLAFQQPDPANTTNPPTGVLLPFHLDTPTTNAPCTPYITHTCCPPPHTTHTT